MSNVRNGSTEANGHASGSEPEWPNGYEPEEHTEFLDVTAAAQVYEALLPVTRDAGAAAILTGALLIAEAIKESEQ